MITLENLKQEFALYCTNTGLPHTCAMDQLAANAAGLTSPKLQEAHVSYLSMFVTRWDNLENALRLEKDRPVANASQYVAAKNWEQLDKLTEGLRCMASELIIEDCAQRIGHQWLAYRDNNGMGHGQVAEVIIEQYERKNQVPRST